MMVLLLANAKGGFCLRQSVVSELGRLGITSVAVLHDHETVGVVLEGWLFDPIRSARAAAAAVGATSDARALHPVMHLAVSAAAIGGMER